MAFRHPSRHQGRFCAIFRVKTEPSVFSDGRVPDVGLQTRSPRYMAASAARRRVRPLRTFPFCLFHRRN